MAWLLLGIAILTEVCGTTALKYSNGFSKPVPTVIALVSFGVALYLVAIVYRTLPVGIVYAIWSGVGIVLTALIAFFVFGQKPSLAETIGMGLIIAGILVINLFSKLSH